MALNFNDLINKPVASEIPEGKYSAKLLRVPENGKSAESGYTGADAHPDDINCEKDWVRFTYAIEVDGKKRTVTDIKNEKGLAVMTSHVRRQYGLQDKDITLAELMSKMIEDGVDIYISRPTVDTTKGYRRVNNVDFVPPLTKPDDAAEQNGNNTTAPVVPPQVTDNTGEPLPF